MRFKFLNMDTPLYLFIAHDNMDRLSPASADTTLKAFDMIELTGDEIAILDIGCGVGDKTVLLANYFEDSIVEAVDIFKHHLAILEDRITENNLNKRVFAYEMNLNDLDFANGEFDLVFSDATVERIGFKRALSEWKRLLKPNGYLIISDVSWLKDPSKDSKRFWKGIYDDIDEIDVKISQIRDEGYEFVGHVVTPKDDWKDYYSKLERNVNCLNSDESARDFVRMVRREIQTFRRNSDDYSYVFYIMKKN